MTIVHIVGINTFIKDNIISKFKELNFEVFDLDLISKNIIFNEDRNIMGKIWKERLQSQLNLFISSNLNKNIIIINTYAFNCFFQLKFTCNHRN